ncbi:MAG: restriction endonuclease [Thermoproteota archaeon]|nr:restriction endonuclease [Thermoproteota archaeon]
MESDGKVRSARLNVISDHEYNTRFTSTHSYSKSRFSRDAEWIIALKMMSLGWNVKLSKGSRGPIDLFASKESDLWYIQVKASSGAPRIKRGEINKLTDCASADGANPVVTTLQPLLDSAKNGTLSVSKFLKQDQNQKHDIYEVDPFQRFSLFFYQLPSWSQIVP